MYAIELRTAENGRQFVMLTRDWIEPAASAMYDEAATLFHFEHDAQAACEYMRQTPRGLDLTAGAGELLQVIEVPAGTPELKKQYVIKVDAEDESEAYVRFDASGVTAGWLDDATRFAGAHAARGAMDHAVERLPMANGKMRGGCLLEEPPGEPRYHREL